MPRKNKVVNLFQEIINKAKSEDDQEEKQKVQITGNGHAFVTGGEPTVNVYNTDSEKE